MSSLKEKLISVNNKITSVLSKINELLSQREVTDQEVTTLSEAVNTVDILSDRVYLIISNFIQLRSESIDIALNKPLQEGTMTEDSPEYEEYLSKINLIEDETAITLFSNNCAVDDQFLLNFSWIDFSKVYNMSYLFQGTVITKVPLINTSSLLSLDNMFENCPFLTDISNFNNYDLSKVGSSTPCIFSKCISLVEVENLSFNNEQKGSRFPSLFNGCTNLRVIHNLDVSNQTSMYMWFASCPSLVEITNQLDVSKVTDYQNTFLACNALVTLRFKPLSIKVSIAFPSSPNLSLETLESIVEGLAVAVTQQSLRLPSKVYNLLTDEMLATISNKNWKVS